jgi:hypothetical protein
MHTSRARNVARRPASEVITVRAISARQRRPTRLARILGLDRNARIELEATGGPARKRGTGTAAALTPRESQIARLASETPRQP